MSHKAAVKDSKSIGDARMAEKKEPADLNGTPPDSTTGLKEKAHYDSVHGKKGPHKL